MNPSKLGLQGQGFLIRFLYYLRFLQELRLDFLNCNGHPAVSQQLYTQNAKPQTLSVIQGVGLISNAIPKKEYPLKTLCLELVTEDPICISFNSCQLCPGGIFSTTH